MARKRSESHIGEKAPWPTVACPPHVCDVVNRLTSNGNVSAPRRGDLIERQVRATLNQRDAMSEPNPEEIKR